MRSRLSVLSSEIPSCGLNSLSQWGAAFQTSESKKEMIMEAASCREIGAAYAPEPAITSCVVGSASTIPML